MTDTGGWGALLRGGLAPRFAILVLGVWLNAADTLVTVTVMPSVAREIGGYAWFGWATAAFLIGAITAGASSGAFAGRIGLRRAMAGAGVLYSLGCVLSAVSPGIGLFLLARLLQGLGAGWIVGLVFVAVGSSFPAGQWARAMAATTSVWGAATLLGPLLGGLFAGFGPGGWRGVFWFFAVQGVVFSLAAARLPKPRAENDPAHGRLPWRQLGVLSLGVAAIASAGLIGGAAMAAGLATAGLALLILALRLDARSPAAMLPRSTADPRAAAFAGYLTIVLIEASASGWSIYGAALTQAIYGATPLIAGYVVAATAVGWTVSALPVAGLTGRWPDRLVRFGGGLVLLGVIASAATMGRSPLAVVFAAGAVMGSGFGVCWAFLTRKVLASLPETERGLGAGAIPTVQMIGAAAGAAAAGALGDVLGLGGGIGRGAAIRLAPLIIGAFAPLAALGWLTAQRLAALPEAAENDPDAAPDIPHNAI